MSGVDWLNICLFVAWWSLSAFAAHKWLPRMSYLQYGIGSVLLAFLFGMFGVYVRLQLMTVHENALLFWHMFFCEMVFRFAVVFVFDLLKWNE